MAAQKKVEEVRKDPATGYDAVGRASATEVRDRLKHDKPLELDVEQSLAEIRDRIFRFQGGMQTHECQDLKVEVNLLLETLELELRENYGG